MKSIQQFFSFMNDISFPYVVLRNFDKLPYDIVLGEHSDLDLLVMDYDHFFEVFPEARAMYELPRVRVRMPIADSVIYIDLRHIGDDYYPADFERSILACREWNERGFFTPDYAHHTAALAYHAVHHKGAVAPEYVKHLGPATIQELLDSLKLSNIGWVPPKDPTVGKFHGYWKGATSHLEKRGEFFAKRQVNFMQYPLIQNEYEMLERFKSSTHCPESFHLHDKELLISDCGEALSAKNIPDDWKAQLRDILFDLHALGVRHRDIKLDNLFVKDGVIRLIDFGWAAPFDTRGGEFELLETAPPSVLGFPNRGPNGPDDKFAMRRVEKQIEFMLEEAEVLS